MCIINKYNKSLFLIYFNHTVQTQIMLFNNDLKVFLS
ncbi:hypothetical protein ZOD2009_12437 [Haladaptatus paucihalophilus DX253]|uniref:Uncharacterized protein n=1 Tax=Haladaptatus paucihalophilus DX253 TaxID=797209 RepID=E7QUK3_HALPU|nr:hypothetical protein ZOD2009_12437 [Haladaptatus paucihalophilus DX253]